jgi:hypothetical protein
MTESAHFLSLLRRWAPVLPADTSRLLILQSGTYDGKLRGIRRACSSNSLKVLAVSLASHADARL